MALPNFLVIGAGRSGTTSLHHYLAQHPDVYLPAVKSPSHFFCCDRPAIDDRLTRALTRNYFVPDPAAYEALFDGVRGEAAIGEVSPVYMATTRVAPRIAARLPCARLIAILRNPVDRAWARYVGRVRDGFERRASFAQIVRQEQRQGLVREVAFDTYVASGFCHHVLRSYFDRFPREQIRIHLFEDFARDPAAVVADLFEFLGVDARFVPDTGRRHNQSGGVIGNPLLRRAWTGSAWLRASVRRWVPEAARDAAFGLVARRLIAPRLDPALRAELVELYHHDIEQVGALVGRDLSAWLG